MRSSCGVSLQGEARGSRAQAGTGCRTRQMNFRVEKTSPFPMLGHGNFPDVGFCLAVFVGRSLPSVRSVCSVFSLPRAAPGAAQADPWSC